MLKTGHDVAVTSILRDCGQRESSAGLDVMDLTSGRSNGNSGSSRVDVGDGGMFAEMNADGPSFSNGSVGRGNR